MALSLIQWSLLVGVDPGARERLTYEYMRRFAQECASKSKISLTRFRLFGEFLVQPCSREGPMAVGGPERDSHGLGDLGHRQAGEVAELDDLGDYRFFHGELHERLVNGDEMVSGRLDRDIQLGQIDT